jgi:hypothetical protein
VKAIDGTPAWGQAMVLEGLALEMTVNIATAISFESFDGQTLKFRNPFPIIPKIGRRVLRHTPSAPEIRGSRVVQLRR